MFCVSVYVLHRKCNRRTWVPSQSEVVQLHSSHDPGAVSAGVRTDNNRLPSGSYADSDCLLKSSWSQATGKHHFS